jgi:two-component system, cell cycle sensor histidine kinase and response regulator CckA
VILSPVRPRSSEPSNNSSGPGVGIPLGERRRQDVTGDRWSSNEIVEWLLGPHPAVTGDRERLTARLFAGLMLVHLGLVVALLLVVNFAWLATSGHDIWHDKDAWTVLAALAIIALAYGLLRAGHHRVALPLYIATTVAVPLVAPFVPDPNAEIGLIATAFIPVLLASVAYSFRGTFIVLAVVVAGSTIQLICSDMPSHQQGTGFSLVVAVAVAGGVLMAIRRHQARLEDRRLDQVRRSEVNYKRLFETITDGILLGDRATRILEVNEALCRQLGYRRDELLGKPASEISARPAVDVEAARARLRQEGHLVVETVHRRKDGTTMPVEVAVTLTEFQGEPVFLSVVRDLSDRRRLEAEAQRLADQLNQSVKMESIGRLAGGVAHDFNNLLTAIIGNAELAAARLPQASPEAALIEQITKAGTSAAALTRQLLAFSRKQLIAPRQLDLNDLIAHTRTMLARLIGEDVALTVDADAALWPVRADASLIEQVLVNLAVNARDAMPNGGALRIRTANTVVDGTGAGTDPELQPGEYATITVADTGTGMSPEVRARIFEPFFTTKPKGRGTGLGLATTYGAVKQSGGHILVDSEPGRGTTFRVFLPRLTVPAPADTTTAVAQPIPRGSETVLVVEDDADVRGLASRILDSLGYRVIQAGSGEDAVAAAQARRDPIDLLLTDVVMPGLNGRQVADMIVSIHPRCRVLFTSGYTDEAIVHHGVLDEGIAFVAKPYTPLALGLKVREVLDQQRNLEA